ncbi:hypothetical protein ABPG74_005463 [Tetrahymena malaccensis]
MSSPKLTQSPCSNEFQESLQGNTFIVSDQQIRSSENMDAYQQSDIESNEQQIRDESVSYNQEEEFLCDDLEDFEVDMQDIDGEQYLEEQALESYFYSLKKRVLTILYQNYQIKQQQKQLLHSILLRFEAKQHFIKWNELSHLNIQKQSQQQENSIQNAKEIELNNSYLNQQKGDTSIQIDQFQADSLCDSINNHQQKRFDCFNNISENKQKEEEKNIKKMKAINDSFQNQNLNESQRQLQIDQMAYNYEEYQNSNVKSFDQVNDKAENRYKTEDSNVLKEQNQVDRHNEFEINAKNMRETNSFQINEDQFIDQEQFDERLDSSSNYSSIKCRVSQIFQNTENGQHDTQTCQNLNIFKQKSQNLENQNTGCSSADRCERSADLKLQIENSASDSQYLRKDDQKSKDLNSDYQSQLIYKNQATEKVILQQTQPNRINFQPQQNKQSELQVEQNIYDEISLDNLSTQKLNQSGIQNKVNNNQRSERRCVYQPQQQQEAIDSYRKESSAKFYNLTINSNNLATLNNIQSQRDNYTQESTQDDKIYLSNNLTTQLDTSKFIRQNEEIQKKSIKNQSALFTQQHTTSTNQVEANILNFDQATLSSQKLKDENSSKQQTGQENIQNQQPYCQVLGGNKQISVDLRQIKFGDEDQQVLDQENYYTHRNNDNDHDKRLSQIEAFSVSKNIELTPVQQQMILSSHRNNPKNNHASSISQELEEEQEQAVDDLAHEVAFYIFGKKLFKKLRLAYKTSRTLDRPQSSRCHLTQYSSNEQLRLQQVKIVTLRKCFDMLKKLKNINQKKKEIQQKLFNYYEIRYIRRPLKIWSQNNKIWIAQKVSLTIISQTILKLQLCEAFKKIKQHSLNKKRVNTINNLLKYYERTSSPYLSKNNTLEKKINQTISKTTHSNNDNGLSKKGQDHSFINNQTHLQSLEYLDKENNSYLCNVNTITQSQGADQVIYQRKNSKHQNQNAISGNQMFQYGSKNVEIVQSQSKQNQNSSCATSLIQTAAATTPNTYQKKLVEQTNYQRQQNMTKSIKNKNQYQSEQPSIDCDSNLYICKKIQHLRNHQPIQISEQGINSCTEIRGNQLNSCNLKASFSELNSKVKNQTSYNSDISGIINDKSSMVYNSSRNTLNSERSNNSKSLCQGYNCISNSFKSDHQCFLKTNEEIANPNSKRNLGNLEFKGQQELNVQKFNEEHLHSSSSLENSQIFESKNNKNSTFSKINQVYLKNEIHTDRQKSQNNLFDQNTNRAPSQINNLNESNFQKVVTDFTCNQERKFQEISQLPFPHQNLNYQESSLTPKGCQKDQIFPNLQNYNDENQCDQNIIKNQNAFTFTHSQIKNSLSVSTQQTNLCERDHHQLNEKDFQQQFLSQKLNNSSFLLKEAGKIKKNSFNKSFIEDQEQSNQNHCLDYKIQNNQQQSQLLANTQESNRGKHSYSFNQNLNYTSNQDNNTINNKQNNLNNDSNGLISFVNRNRSISRINQQLEQQAEAFNSKKLNSSRNQLNNLSFTEQQSQSCNDQMLSSKINGHTLFLSCQQGQNNQIEQEIYQNKIQQDRQANNNSIKPPLQHYQQKTNRSNDYMMTDIRPQSQQLNISQQVNKMAKIEQNIKQKQQNFQKDLNADLNTLDSSIQYNQRNNYNPHFLENNQILNSKQKQEIIPIQSAKQDECCSQHYQSLHMQEEPQQYKTSTKYSASQNQTNQKVNQFGFQSQESIVSSLPQNYLSHLKNQQFSQKIQETAEQIEKGKLPITQKKQEQIKQLQQYQYFKQIQQQRSQQQQQHQQHSNKKLTNSSSVNNSFSKNAQKQQIHKNSNNNDSINVSQERNNKKDLSGVGQSIQNILYFEAKIRSKRLARSQERSKNDSMELCKKLENLEQYIEQINYELKQEKEKKSILLQENAQLTIQQDQN